MGDTKYTVNNILEKLNEIAPFETAEDYDNIGLMVGNRSHIVESILFCVDCTIACVKEAIDNKCNVIIAHHPLLFGGINDIDTETPRGIVIQQLIKHDITLLAVHTNLDIAKNGIADSLANTLELLDIQGIDFMRIGTLKKQTSASELTKQISEILNINARLYGRENEKISKLALAPGAGSETYIIAKQLGAQAFLTGETKHHQIIDSCALGMVVIDAGHFGTEYPGILALCNYFNNYFADNNINIPVITSTINPFTDI